MSQLGGSGTIRVQGAVTFASGEFGTFLTSVQDGSGDPPPADTGELVVEGTATLSNLGLGIYTGYHVTIANGGRCPSPPTRSLPPTTAPPSPSSRAARSSSPATATTTRASR